ncbi:MAG: glycosyltransferase [Candidatus Poribacteria bacterium]|nr:glycosyltransferase family 4 protein [Candidatus Poribacteria bacterium]MCZ6675979.1 glycosyltransferase [Candidatus Poribacteria bacterium]
MKVIFLRGAVPPAHEHPEKLLYKDIEQCEDMWTQLFYTYLKVTNSSGELLYTGGNRVFKVDDRLTERWMPKLSNYNPSFEPDLVIARGGFSYYDAFVARCTKAKKVYYGAGARYYPTSRFRNYDLFLTDAVAQRDAIRNRHGQRAELFIKPAARLFKKHNVRVDHDICFMANATQAHIKRHALFLRAMTGTRYRVLALGNTSPKYIELARKLGVRIRWSGWRLRKYLPAQICRCKIGVVCSTNYDSCPRVIPEYMACGLPVVVTENVNFWKEKYITKQTGVLAKADNLVAACEAALKLKSEHVVSHYRNSLSMDKAAEHLAQLLRSIM